jgi:hypothetical protein
MEIEGLAELERSGLREDDREMYDKLRWLLTIHTLDEWKRFKRSLSSQDQKTRLVRVICRMERNTGFRNIFDRHNGFEEKIVHLNRCWDLPTRGG